MSKEAATHGGWDKFMELLKDKGQDVLLPGIAATLGTGALSGYMTSREGLRKGETPAERRARILKNALIASALTGGTIAGGTALSALGEHSFNEDPPPRKKYPIVGEAPGMIKDIAMNAATEPLWAAGGGATGYGAGMYLDNKLFGQGRTQALDDMADLLGRSRGSLRTAGPDKLTQMMNHLKTTGHDPKKINKLLSSGGVRFSGKKHLIPALLSTVLGLGAGSVASVGSDVSKEL